MGFKFNFFIKFYPPFCHYIITFESNVFQASVHASGGAFRCGLRGGDRSGAGGGGRGRGGRGAIGVIAVDGELPDAARRSAKHLAPQRWQRWQRWQR